MINILERQFDPPAGESNLLTKIKGKNPLKEILPKEALEKLKK